MVKRDDEGFPLEEPTLAERPTLDSGLPDRDFRVFTRVRIHTLKDIQKVFPDVTEQS